MDKLTPIGHRTLARFGAITPPLIFGRSLVESLFPAWKYGYVMGVDFGDEESRTVVTVYNPAEHIEISFEIRKNRTGVKGDG